MGIFKKTDGLDEAAESGRLRPEDLVAPRPDRQDEAASGKDEAESGPGEGAKVEEAKDEEPQGEAGTKESTDDSRAKQPDKPKNEGPAKVIAFANQKGGVAKTTTALNLAVAFKESGHRVLCIDIYPPPSRGLLTVNALTAANKVIVPVQCEYLSMRGLVQLQNTLTMIRENLNPGVEIEGILPTMLDSRTVHAKEAVEILEENFGDLVFMSRIRKAIKFAEAPVRGSSVLKYDPT